MNPIASALTQGFTPQNVLQYLLRHFPHARKQIESALAKGYTADKIVGFLQGGRKEVNKPVTEHEKMRQSDKDKQRGLEKGILKGAAAIGATALGGYALSRALPRASSALQGQLLPALPPGPAQIDAQTRPQLPAPGQAAMQPPAPQAPQGPLPYTNPSAQNRPIPNTQPQPTPQAPLVPSATAPIANPTATPTKSAPLPKEFHKMAKDMLDTGNDPETIAGAFKKFYPEKVKKYEEATGQPIDGAVQDFASQNMPEKPQEKALPVSSPIMEEGLQAVEKTTTPIAEPTTTPIKKEKGSTVALPNGDIGEITHIRQGIATVNANGKEFRRKVEELIEPPMEQKDLAELYKDLVSGIEEKTGEEVSRMVNWAGYDPKTNELAFVPHLGALYVYDNISPEDAAELTSILSTRKSTGENFIGAWKQGSKSPIGAAMYKLIQKLQKERGGKGSEYKGKYEKIYDAFELPKIEAKTKISEKKKLLKEKEDDKKRKAKKPRAS